MFEGIEQVAAVPPAAVVGVDADAVDQRFVLALGCQDHADGLVALDGNHAAARPQVELADVQLELVDRQARRAVDVLRVAAVIRLGQQRDVVGAAEPVPGHEERLLDPENPEMSVLSPVIGPRIFLVGTASRT